MTQTLREKIWDFAEIQSFCEKDWIEVRDFLLDDLSKFLKCELTLKNFVILKDDHAISCNFSWNPKEGISNFFAFEGIFGMEAEPGRIHIPASIFFFRDRKRIKFDQGDFLELEYKRNKNIDKWTCIGWQEDIYGEFESITGEGSLS